MFLSGLFSYIGSDKVDASHELPSYVHTSSTELIMDTPLFPNIIIIVEITDYGIYYNIIFIQRYVLCHELKKKSSQSLFFRVS